MWYYLEGEQNRGPFSAAQMQDFIARKVITGYTNVWREGLPAWVPLQDSELAHLLAAAPAIVSPQADPRLQNPYWTDYGGGQPAVTTATLQSQQYQYRSPETLKTTLLVMAGILAIAHVVMIVSYYAQIDLLTKFENGFYANNEAQAQADGEAHDQQHMLLVFSQLGISLVFAIIFFFWIYRVKANTWALGASGMTITPGWGIGWFFVPFMNLVRPYQSLQETWKASTSPADWQHQPGSSLIGWWWFFWISSSILGRIGVQMSKDAKDLASLLRVSYFDFATEFYEFLPLLTLTLMIVRISNKQTALALDASMSTRQQDYLR